MRLPKESWIKDAYRRTADAAKPSLPTVLGVCYELAGCEMAGEGDLTPWEDADSDEAWFEEVRDKCSYDYIETVLRDASLPFEGFDEPELPGPESPPALPASTEVVETINRHRRGLGMDPLDPSSGWSAKELRDMAESIRTTGRMMNPAQQRLKAKLMR